MDAARSWTRLADRWNPLVRSSSGAGLALAREMGLGPGREREKGNGWGKRFGPRGFFGTKRI